MAANSTVSDGILPKFGLIQALINACSYDL